MYIRLSANCDKVIVLKSISKARTTFDANGNEIVSYDKRGNVIKANTTVPVASFCHNEKIQHEEIDPVESAAFESWRKAQLGKIQAAMTLNATNGVLGGRPLAKLRANHGDPSAKVGEFSGIIEDAFAYGADSVKDAVNGVDTKKAVEEADDLMGMAAEDAHDFFCAELDKLSEKLIGMILHDKKVSGKPRFNHTQVLEMFAKASVFRKGLDTRLAGFKCEGNLAEKDVSKDDAHLIGSNINVISDGYFEEMKKKLSE